MQAGFFSTNITPPIGTMQAGNYNRQYIQGLAGSMKVRAAVFEQDGLLYAFAGVDCCAIDRATIAAALEYARQQAGIQFAGHIISASHTHSGAAVSAFFDFQLLQKADPKVLALLQDSPLPDPWYNDWVRRQLASALIMAYKSLQPCLLNSGIGHEDSMVFNRRFYLKDGRAYTHPGKMNPDIVEPAGPIDPAVGVLGAWRPDGSLIGCLLNYSCHGTTHGGRLTHADWYHHAEQTLQKLFGREVGTVILNGACGDITQVNNQSFSKDTGPEISYKLGFRVAAEAAKLLVSQNKHKYSQLAAASCELPLKRRRPSSDSVTRAWETLARCSTSTEPDAVFARERLIAAELARLEPLRLVTLSAIQLGDTLFLANPAEYFCSLGLKVKAGSGFQNCMLVELANDIVGYVPDLEAFDPVRGGGYETVLTAYSNLQPEAGDLIAEKLIEMAGKFKPEQIPATASQEPGSLWDYGRRGPDLH
ncbi:MAG: hypothetical protein RBT25_02265 [Lentisphaeria bacterium]|nr:hypothetical protein [Lentisphaeria bacterium]